MVLLKIACRILSYINKLFPKFNQVIVQGYPNDESSAISVANYISSHYEIPVYYVIFNDQEINPRPLLSSEVIILNFYSENWKKSCYLFKYLTSKYIFFTHESILDFFSSNQTVTNIWHGVLYKKVGVLNGQPPLPADVTVATSQNTKKMFAKAFGVSIGSTFASGYPRNDMLLDANKNKVKQKKSISDLNSFDKVAIWMPTYRKNVRWNKNGIEDGNEVGNPFYIKNFNITAFDKLLKDNNTLCLVKPHPYAPTYKDAETLDNVRFIDNKWIVEQVFTLYQLLGCTDLLISDVSSVIIDYMLTDQPIICVSTDFDEYKKTRGFYFDDIKSWIPSRVNKTQKDFFSHLSNILSNKEDPAQKKRKRLKNYFFDYHDTRSTERLVQHVMDQ